MPFKIDWGTGMAALFSLFVVFILGLVFYSAKQSYHLVEHDYYNEELNYQVRIEQIERFRKDPAIFGWSYNNSENSVIFRYTGEPEDSVAGEIRFYRPSDSSLDFLIPVQLNDVGTMEVSTDGLRKGLWKIKALISANGTEYYREEMLIVE